MDFPIENFDIKVADLNDLKNFQIISVKNFYNINDDQRIDVDKSIEKNYLEESPFLDQEASANFSLKFGNTFFFSDLYKEFYNFCYKIFDGFETLVDNQFICWCYRSNKDDYYSAWHNHLNTSTINGVYYYSIYNDGIYFEKDGKVIYYLPEQNELLIFPNHLHHKPKVATSENLRYSINMEIITEETSLTLFERYGLP